MSRWARSGTCPSKISWAEVTMALWAAWRKMWESRTTGKKPESMMSLSKLPAPTEGSWS